MVRRGVTGLVAVVLVAFAGPVIASAPVSAATSTLTWSAPLSVDSTPPLGATTRHAVGVVPVGRPVRRRRRGRKRPDLHQRRPEGASTWQRALVDPGSWLAAVSCPTDRAVRRRRRQRQRRRLDRPDRAAPGTWSKTSVSPGVVVDAVSCPTTSFCLAADQAGHVFHDDQLRPGERGRGSPMRSTAPTRSSRCRAPDRRSAPPSTASGHAAGDHGPHRRGGVLDREHADHRGR